MCKEVLRKINVYSDAKRTKEFFEYIGIFHQWYVDDEGYLMAVIEKEDGSVITKYYSEIQFIKE